MQALVKVACVQAAPVFLDIQATVEKTLALIAEAASQGAHLIAFPEAWIPGYPWFLWLNSPVSYVPLIQRYRENSLVLGTEQAQRISDAARRHAIHVVLGYSERNDKSLYIGQWLIDDRGHTLGLRRKTKIPRVERILFDEGAPPAQTCFTSRLGTLQAKCSLEHLQTTGRDVIYSASRQIHIVAWPGFNLYRHGAAALGLQINVTSSRMYANEGPCFVLAPCAVISESVIELLCRTDYQRSLLKAGGGFARIFSPDGQELAKPLGEHEEGILYATLNDELSLQSESCAGAV